MVVRLKEWLKPYTWGDGVEITANNVINLLLRSENNLIQVNEDHEAYVDLQLEDWISTTDTLPVGVTTGRVLVADGRPVAWTMLCFKTTSWDYVTWIYWDDGKLYIDNGTGTFKQIYLKSEVDALFTQLRNELDTVAFTWDYNDLTNKPTLWTAAALDAGTDPWEVPVIWNDGRLDPTIVPSTWVMNVFTVTNKSDLTTISNAVKGDIAIVTSENKTYILSDDPYSTLSNWTELLFPTWAVSSVNWFTWAVNLTTGYISESWDNLFVSSSEKQSWSSKLGTNNVATVALTGNYNDLNNKPTVDTAMSDSSTNAVQNKIIKAYVDTTASWSASAVIDDTAYWSSWDGDTTHAPSKNAVYDEVNTINTNITNMQTDITNLQNTTSWLVSDVAYSSAWDWDTTHAPSKNTVYDVLGDINTLLANI